MSWTGKINDFIPLGMTHIREVSFPVPKYFSIQMELDKLKEENKRLQEQLNIVTKQRDDIHIGKQVLQKQLNEANDTLIKSQNMKQPDRNNFVAQYLLKWGVK